MFSHHACGSRRVLRSPAPTTRDRSRCCPPRHYRRLTSHAKIDNQAQPTLNVSPDAAALIVLGGADEGSTLVVGPEHGRNPPLVVMEHILKDVHEVSGVGTIFPDVKGTPVAHIHIASGRRGETITGCVRRGVKVWQVMEVILWEIANTASHRRVEPPTGLELLQP